MCVHAENPGFSLACHIYCK